MLVSRSTYSNSKYDIPRERERHDATSGSLDVRWAEGKGGIHRNLDLRAVSIQCSCSTGQATHNLLVRAGRRRCRRRRRGRRSGRWSRCWAVLWARKSKREQREQGNLEEHLGYRESSEERGCEGARSGSLRFRTNTTAFIRSHVVGNGRRSDKLSGAQQQVEKTRQRRGNGSCRRPP